MSNEPPTRRPRPGPVVISSLTGKPMDWPQGDETQDTPEPRNSQSNDARLAGDVPPHWGRGR